MVSTAAGPWRWSLVLGAAAATAVKVRELNVTGVAKVAPAPQGVAPAPLVDGCVAACALQGAAPWVYVWREAPVTSTFIAANVLAVINPVLGNTEWQTTTHPVPPGVTSPVAPATNGQGTQVLTTTVVNNGQPAEVVISYPNPYLQWQEPFTFNGVWPTKTSAGPGAPIETVCVTAALGGQTVALPSLALQGPVEVSPSDPGGLHYKLVPEPIENLDPQFFARYREKFPDQADFWNCAGAKNPPGPPGIQLGVVAWITETASITASLSVDVPLSTPTLPPSTPTGNPNHGPDGVPTPIDGTDPPPTTEPGTTGTPEQTATPSPTPTDTPTTTTTPPDTSTAATTPPGTTATTPPDSSSTTTTSDTSTSETSTSETSTSETSTSETSTSEASTSKTSTSETSTSNTSTPTTTTSPTVTSTPSTTSTSTTTSPTRPPDIPEESGGAESAIAGIINSLAFPPGGDEDSGNTLLQSIIAESVVTRDSTTFTVLPARVTRSGPAALSLLSRDQATTTSTTSQPRTTTTATARGTAARPGPAAAGAPSSREPLVLSCVSFTAVLAFLVPLFGSFIVAWRGL